MHRLGKPVECCLEACVAVGCLDLHADHAVARFVQQVDFFAVVIAKEFGGHAAVVSGLDGYYHDQVFEAASHQWIETDLLRFFFSD